MARYKSIITGQEKTADGSSRNVTKQFLVDKDGNVLKDENGKELSREDNAEGVARRIEVEAHKEAIRNGDVLRVKNAEGKWEYQGLFWEEFPGTIDQAEAEMAEEIKMKAEIQKDYDSRLKKAGLKK